MESVKGEFETRKNVLKLNRHNNFWYVMSCKYAVEAVNNGTDCGGLNKPNLRPL